MDCFDVEVRLGDSYVGEEMSEYFCIVVYFDHFLHPISIDIPVDETLLENFDLGKCLEHLKFEISAVDLNTQSVYYQHTSETVH
ncbi:MAG: hypothetical protein GY861_26110 [bacterium]|nr:hypothetical protein [bacterium]